MLLFLVKYSYSIFPKKAKIFPYFFNIPLFLLNIPLFFSKYSCVFLLFYMFYMLLLNKKISYKGFNIKYQNKLSRVSYSVLKLEYVI